MVENTKKIKIVNNAEGIHQLEAFVEDICYEYNIINTYFSNIQIALHEAFMNAKIHGNQNEDGSEIEIEFYSDKKGLHFLIKDQGDGFDFQKFQNMDIDELLEVDDKDEGQRGLLVIRMLVDEMNFLHNGTVIELVFYISSINYTLTVERMKHLELYFKNVVLLKT